MITLLSAAAAGNAASDAAPASAVRRWMLKVMVKLPCLLFPEHLPGRGAPADMNRLSDLRREAAAVGDLDHQAVGRRQPHMDVDLGAEIGYEFHRAGQVVVESRQRAGPDLQPFGPQRQRRLARSAAFDCEVETAVGAEAPVSDGTGQEGRAADEARHEAVGRSEERR